MTMLSRDYIGRCNLQVYNHYSKGIRLPICAGSRGNLGCHSLRIQPNLTLKDLPSFTLFNY